MSAGEFLQGQLERLFELEGMMALSSELLGVEPAEVGGTGAKGTFARALVRHCESHDGLLVLAEAIRVSANERDQAVERLPSTDDELEVGSEVKSFRILKLLDRTALATVYLAERPAPSNGHTEHAHLKVFRKECTRDRIAAWRLLTGARALSEVRDTGLVGIYDAGTLPDGRVFVASEAVIGQTLSNRLVRVGPVPFAELRPIARTFLRGLAALHERNLLHGYLSAEHLLIVKPEAGARGERTAYGVLSELATARLFETHLDGVPGVLRLTGDPSVLAPEVARGQAASTASEIYAAGCLLYRALTGYSVFEAATPIEQISAHLYEEPQPPSERAPRYGITPELDEVILRALSKDPRERQQTARELADAIEGVARISSPPGTALSQDDLVRAISALQESPSDQTVAAELEAVVAPSGDWQEAIEAFIDVAEQSEDVEVKKQLLFRSARILADELNDHDAAERMYRAVLDFDASNAQAHNAIEELYRDSGDHEMLVSLLLDRLENETSPDERASILREVATLYEEQLTQPDSALVAWAQALAEEPSDERAKRAIERLAVEPGQLEEVLAVLKDAISENSERPQHALALSVISAEWYQDKLARLDAALPYLNDALQIDPAHEPALEALSRLYRSAEAWSELFDLLLRRADVATSPSKQRDYKAEAAAVAHTKLEDTELAERTFVEVLRDDPTHPVAVAALEEIYADAGNLEKLVELLELKAKELRGQARATALCELAELYEDDDSTVERAIEHYKSAIAADDKHLAAYKGLGRIYAARGDREELLRTLERERACATTPQQRMALLEQIGELYEQHDPTRAAESYEQIIELAPGHESANVALERLYRTLHRFDDLAQTYDRHAKGVEDKTRKVELLMLAARVLMADIGSPERAAFVCERVLSVVPNHPEALTLTARIRALAGDNMAALDGLEVLADTEQDPQTKADLWVRAGQMLESHDDNDGAIERYRSALDAVRGHGAALEALSRLYERRGDVRGEAELMMRRVELASDPKEQAERLIALGKLRLDKLKDRDLAAEAYQLAHELDPDNRAALIGLGQLALADKRWQAAVELLEPLIGQASALPSDVARQLLTGVGDAYRELNDPSSAERAYSSARGLYPNDRVINERLADLALQAERYDEAAELLSSLLDAKVQSKTEKQLSNQDRSELLLKLGRAREQLGQLDHAAAAFSSASELAPEAVAPLSALSDVQEKQGHWEALARSLRRRLELEEDKDQRFGLMVRTGDAYAQLKDRNQAARFYVSALELDADDRNLLSKLMAVYSESKDWSRLVDVLVRMAQVVEEPLLCAKYLYTAAGIAHTELHNLEDAIEYYETALGFDPSLESAFKGLVDTLTKAGAWDRLANAYRAQLERRKEELDSEQLAALWDTLGAIYLERLHRLDPAVEAYEAASELEPENRARVEQLVELYGRQPSRFADRAIAAHERLLASNPYRVESYRALRKLYTQLQRPDEAWTVCQALRSLNMAEPEEEAFFKRHRVQAPATARECITEELWQEHVLLPEQDDAVTAMLALIQPAAVQELAQDPEAFGVARDRMVDCEHDNSVMAQMLHYAGGVMLVPLPPVFYRPRDSGGVSFLSTNPPAIGLGQGALRSSPDQALAFIAGRQLSYFRPGHYMRQLVPSGSGLRSWLLAAIRLANPRFPAPEPMREQVERNVAALARTLHAPQQHALTSLVERLLREQPELDMKRWALAVDLAADRIGFVLANSLDAAVAVVRASPQDSSYASERDRLKALYQYAVSPKYTSLRKAIGVTIG
ncbi:MAG: serine/threonine protein kinase [Myxococcaceae bacterium]|nr:serine/threonine protein kinase [Myxococcaceae bacterium]